MNGENSVSKSQTWGVTASLKQPTEFHRKHGIWGQGADCMLVSKSDGLSFICRICMVEGKKQLLQRPPLAHHVMVTRAHKHTHKE